MVPFVTGWFVKTMVKYGYKYGSYPYYVQTA